MSRKPLNTPEEILEHVIGQHGCLNLDCMGSKITGSNARNSIPCPLVIAEWHGGKSSCISRYLHLVPAERSQIREQLAKEKLEEYRKLNWLEKLQ